MPLYFLPEERSPEAAEALAEALADAEGEALADADAEAVSEAVVASDGEAEPVPSASGRISLAHAVNAESAPVKRTRGALRRTRTSAGFSPGCSLGFLPWGSAEFRQSFGRVLAEFWQSFGRKKPRPRRITAGGGEAQLKLLCLNRYGGV